MSSLFGSYAYGFDSPSGRMAVIVHRNLFGEQDYEVVRSPYSDGDSCVISKHLAHVASHDALNAVLRLYEARAL